MKFEKQNYNEIWINLYNEFFNNKRAKWDIFTMKVESHTNFTIFFNNEIFEHFFFTIFTNEIF